LSPIYRLSIRETDLNQPGWIMTIAFLVLVPVAMGYLSVDRYLRASAPEDIRWYEWIFLPWASVLLAMLVSVLVKWEGFICLIFAGPIMLFFSLWGGVAARIAWGKLEHRSPGTLSAFVLPMLLLIVERHIPAPDEIRIVNTETLIHAPA